MTRPRPVFDCFTFFNELDLLEMRLEEMERAVDVVVIAESPVTFQGKPKPLVFDENRARFRRHLPRIRHLVVADMPEGEETWPREEHQRNALRRGLADAPDDATILISDVDEIIRPHAVEQARQAGAFRFLAMDLHLYFLDRRAGPWLKAYAAPWSFVRAMERLSAPREQEANYLQAQGMDPALHIIPDAGWHFTWMGGVERMLVKLDAFSHVEEEVQKWRDPDALARSLAEERFFHDGRPLLPAPLAELPAAVRRDPLRYHGLGLLSARPGWRDRLTARLQRTAR